MPPVSFRKQLMSYYHSIPCASGLIFYGAGAEYGAKCRLCHKTCIVRPEFGIVPAYKMRLAVAVHLAGVLVWSIHQ